METKKEFMGEEVEKIKQEGMGWKSEYFDDNGGPIRDLDREEDENFCPEKDDIGRYEIVFDRDGKRYYCFVDAVSMDEALGNFFRNHGDVRYEEVWEHMEV